MNSITIVTIVVITLLTIAIGALTWLAYFSCIKMYKAEVILGKYDTEIQREFNESKKKRTIGGIIGNILSYSILLAVAGLLTIGVVYKVRGENFSINNQTALVIRSGSMSEFYDESLAEHYNNDTSLQFNIGDLCFFEEGDFELVEGEVYGYKRNNLIITHRLVKSYDDNLYEFRGDSNSKSDTRLVSKDQIIYHYTGKKVPGIGVLVIFAQSYFGLWSMLGVVGILTGSEISYYKISKINKERNNALVAKKGDELCVTTE